MRIFVAIFFLVTSVVSSSFAAGIADGLCQKGMGYTECYQNFISDLSSVQPKNNAYIAQKVKFDLLMKNQFPLGANNSQINKMVVAEISRLEVGFDARKQQSGGGYLDRDKSYFVKLRAWFESGANDDKDRIASVDNWKVWPYMREDRAGGWGRQMFATDKGACYGKIAPIKECEDYLSDIAFVDANSAYVAYMLVNSYSEYVEKLAAEYGEREKKWEAYLYGYNFMYPWELKFNKYVTDRDSDLVVKDSYGNQLGVKKVPMYSYILVHPDIGVQYINDAEKGDKFSPTITVEWFGMKKWNGFSERGLEGLKGVSLVSTVVDRKNYNTVDLGLMFHWQDYAFALTSNKGSVALTLNLKLGDKIGSVNKDTAEEMKRLDSDRK